jgi:hypothetical protein
MFNTKKWSVDVWSKSGSTGLAEDRDLEVTRVNHLEHSPAPRPGTSRVVLGPSGFLAVQV